MDQTLSGALIDSIVGGYNGDPFAVLGPHAVTHEGEPSVAVRALVPWATSLSVVFDGGATYEMWRLHPFGFFEAVSPHNPLSQSQLCIARQEHAGTGRPICATPTLSAPSSPTSTSTLSARAATTAPMRSWARTCRGQRRARRAFRGLGTQRRRCQRGRQLQRLGRARPPDALAPRPGHLGAVHPRTLARANLQVRDQTRATTTAHRQDRPLRLLRRIRPRTASVVADLDHYEWHDASGWPSARATDIVHAPISIYEVHLGSWKRNPQRGQPDGDFVNYRIWPTNWSIMSSRWATPISN